MEINSRPLIEFNLSEELCSEENEEAFEKYEIYLNTKSSFIHQKAAEYIFYIPNSEEVFNEEYGEAPEPIKNCLKAAFDYHTENKSEDFGYVLIYL